MSPATSDRRPAAAARFRAALARFDRAHADDPGHELAGGRPEPRELLYARRMTETLERFAPDASEALRLAARCQHIRRWTVPRDAYPAGRAGYLRWRTRLAHLHAETAAEILRDVGYDDDAVARVQALLRKQRLAADPEAQTLEDVVCLVFLRHYLPAFAARHDDEKLVGILGKTWCKMSERGRAAALGLDLDPGLKALVAQAADARG